MSPARQSLKAFLATARKALSTPPTQASNPLTFVLGNESADLDSLFSAVVLAYLHTHAPPHTLHIPLSNLPRADLALRPELTAVLRPAGLASDDLLTLSDLPKDGLHPENTRWLLVDHNAPTGALSSQLIPSTSILGCIDHHADEGRVPHGLAATSQSGGGGGGGGPRVIEKSGSCMSLVVEHCRETWSRLSTESAEADDNNEHDSQLAHLALGPILIDTTNLTSRDKTTEWDIRAVEFAEQMLRRNHQQKQQYDRTKYYDEITRLKEDVRGMSYRDILRKDYKQWAEGGLLLGTSVVVQGLGYLLREIGDKPKLLDAVKSWAQEQGLDIAVVMTVSRPDGVFTRELLVWAFGEEAVRVARQFVEDNGCKLGLEMWGDGQLDMVGTGNRDGGREEWRMCWRQKGVESSRKQVAPMLREAIQKASKL